ncbi:hypothetical protein [Pontiella sulfatireligans]|uniref:Glycosyltransferase RgtA/B/C/D-like domain-containing protein n=1 Tax=Pontiella sulfatireligans TaxID=2750658 RepID=A0A6C2UFT7_9BACT|nr:hypothetical protein [Pontiella sulfatireligans]VGO18291.1 hypothetical protein SCARR_00343 [Pontiella sulfatireligans]
MTLKQSFWLMFIFFALMASCTVIFQPLEKAVAFAATDDGLYYPKLAQTIAAGGECSYDGVTATNGFHPLWLLVLLPVYALFSDPWVSLKAVYLLIFVLQLLSMGLFALIARRVRMSSAGWCAAICIMTLNIRSFTIFFSLLESPLILLCYLLYLVHCLRVGERRYSDPVPAFVGGVLIGLCFLARLDAFLLAGAFAVSWLVHVLRNRPDGRTLWKSPFFSALGCLALVLPYLLWNQINFGHLKTVSSWQKTTEFSPVASGQIISSWSLHQFIPRVQYILGLESIPAPLLLAGMVLAGIAGLLFVLTGSRRRRLFEKLSFFPEFPLFVVVHACFIVLLAPLDAAASAWYWVPEILLAALVAGACVPDVKVWRVPVFPLLAVLLVAAQLALYPKFLERKTMTFVKLEVAEFLRENTAPDMRGMMFDSGIIAYFSQRNFVGLNGLIGDFELANFVREKEYVRIADLYGVGVLVLDAPEKISREFADCLLYSSFIKTKFENFSEAPKPFMVFQGTPQELASIWNARYQGMR